MNLKKQKTGKKWRERERETDRQTDRQRQTDREIETETETTRRQLLKTTPPSPGDSSGSESEDCLSRGKRRRPSDSGSSGAEGVASQTPLKISKIGEGGMIDVLATSSAPASPTKSMTATPRSAAQADKGEVGLPLPPAKKDKAHAAPAAPKATNVPRQDTLFAAGSGQVV